MRPRIPETTRRTVVEMWLLGYPRNTIAVERGISNGTVTSIVDEWRRSTGVELAELMRIMGVTLRKLGITPSQCLTGLRVHNLISRIGWDENSLEDFLSTVYGKCQELGVNPSHIAKYIQELTSLLENKKIDGDAVSIQRIDAIFEERRRTKTDLEEEVDGLQSKAQKLHIETSLSERNLEELVRQKTALEADLSWNINLRDQLKEQGLNANIVSRVLDAARFFSNKKFSIEELLTRFSSAEGMENTIQDQEQQLESLNQDFRSLKEETRVQDELLAERKLKNSELDQLKKMGFGLWDLKLLRNLVTELAIENGQATENGVAVKRFFSDIEKHYPDYLRLRDRVGQLRADEANLRAIIGEVGQMGTAVKSFLNRSPTQDDIREVTELLEGYPRTSSLSPSSSKKSIPIPPDLPLMPDPRVEDRDRSTN